MKKLVIALAVTACVAAPLSSSAQTTIIRSHVYMNRASARAMIHDVQLASNDFRDVFESRYNRMFQPNWRHADRDRAAVQALDRALEHVDARNRNGEKPQYLRDDVKTVVSRAQELDRHFRNPDVILATMTNEWARLKDQINDLAAMYELPGVDG